MAIIFENHEIAAAQKHPEILRALADYHDYQATCAEASDYLECVPVHEARAKELREWADQLESLY